MFPSTCGLDRAVRAHDEERQFLTGQNNPTQGSKKDSTPTRLNQSTGVRHSPPFVASTACTTYLRPAAKRDCCDVSPYLSVIYRQASLGCRCATAVGDRQHTRQRADEFAPKKYVCRTNRKRVGNPQDSNKKAANDATSRRDGGRTKNEVSNGCGVIEHRNGGGRNAGSEKKKPARRVPDISQKVSNIERPKQQPKTNKHGGNQAANPSSCTPLSAPSPCRLHPRKISARVVLQLWLPCGLTSR